MKFKINDRIAQSAVNQNTIIVNYGLYTYSALKNEIPTFFDSKMNTPICFKFAVHVFMRVIYYFACENEVWHCRNFIYCLL